MNPRSLEIHSDSRDSYKSLIAMPKMTDSVRRELRLGLPFQVAVFHFACFVGGAGTASHCIIFALWSVECANNICGRCVSWCV